ncbi:hypothetical protein ACMV_31500 [Acidiphilium multivorum AIU301]|uniref:Uncharacterized protein n=1 Tax=Acidiphilium multivorum (strain DSM 11245 / JCM 8867 / NBRC 100883 / AIU 301) TaxID=926570 RepID=F0J5V3_ACIMA|nr:MULTISPECIES: hypothetical protein [Acidiphilium]BAJ82497.1 hypothetical protein ACMV_31500 [Acidiphilium multivorum AIU301]GAN74058.1 hypothetical protein Apmu_0133_09 [Acidiphilium multivorum AIU301]
MSYTVEVIEDKKSGAADAVLMPELIRRRAFELANGLGLPMTRQSGDGFDYLAVLDVPSQSLDDDYVPERWLIELHDDGSWGVFDAGDNGGAGGCVVAATLLEALERVHRTRREALRDA